MSLGGETMRTQYNGQSSPVDTIREGEWDVATWESQHLMNILGRWQTEDAVFSLSPIGAITIEYAATPQESILRETLCQPTYKDGAVPGNLNSWKRQFIADMRATWASKTPATS